MPKPNWGNAAQGGIQGGTLGFQVGGPPGAAIGGGLGALAGLFGFGASNEGTPDSFTSEQKKLIGPLYGGLNELNPQGLSALSQLLNYQPESLEDMQRPAMEQFQQQIVPSILERFSGLGASRSSALNQTLGEASKGLATNLASMRANALQNATQVRQNALQQLLGMNQLLLQTPYQKGQASSAGLYEQMAPYTGRSLEALLQNYMKGSGGSPTSLEGAFGSEFPQLG